MRKTFSRWALATALSTLSCGGLSLDLGGDDSPESSTSNTTPACSTDEELDFYVGSWVGVTDQPPASAYSSVHLEIVGASRSSGICGTVRFGTGTPPPPAQDPDEEYPPVPDSPSLGNVPFPGYPYTIVSGQAERTRMHLVTNDKELWKSWCELQTPVFDSAGNVHSLCLPDGDYLYSSDVCYAKDSPNLSVRYGIAKCTNCVRRRTCTCDAGGCGVNAEFLSHWPFTTGSKDRVRTLTLTLQGLNIELQKTPAE